MMDKTYFPEGVMVGLIVAICMIFALDRMRDNHADYWRGAFCMEAESPPSFCVQDEQFQFYLDTMAMVIESIEDQPNDK